jgi:hypothetical protein
MSVLTIPASVVSHTVVEDYIVSTAHLIVADPNGRTYETLIMGEDIDSGGVIDMAQLDRRYSDRDDAIEGHYQVVNALRGVLRHR